MTPADAPPPGAVVETERLVLRPFEPGDFDAYRTLRAKPSLHQHMPGGPAGVAEADAKARTIIDAWNVAGWADGGAAPWAVIEKASGRLLGHLGLRRVDEIDAVELLYLLDDAAQGKGYATEAGRAALDVADRILGLDRVVALALPENAASIAVMKRLGMTLFGPRRVFGLDAVEYEIRLR